MIDSILNRLQSGGGGIERRVELIADGDEVFGADHVEQRLIGAAEHAAEFSGDGLAIGVTVTFPPQPQVQGHDSRIETGTIHFQSSLNEQFPVQRIAPK